MEEVYEYLQSSTQDVEGVKMVTLESALHAVELAVSTISIESIEKSLADIYKSLEEFNDLSDEDDVQ
jgi:hypothetical protein